MWVISTSDPDGDSVEFSQIGEGFDQYGSGKFGNKVDKDSIQYVFTAPNVDDVDTGDHVYSNIKITATDSKGASKSAYFTVTVTDNDGGSCFLAGTKVTMADNSFKNIEEIKIGDLVKSYDTDAQKIITTKVVKTFHHTADEMMQYYLIINDNLKVTPNHLMYVNNEWKPAEDIEIGDKLIDTNEEEITVKTIERVYQKVPTYNLIVDHKVHNYFAENILVHNGKR
jgi:hypothetical protein